MPIHIFVLLIGYRKHGENHDTKQLSMSPETPGIMIIQVELSETDNLPSFQCHAISDKQY